MSVTGRKERALQRRIRGHIVEYIRLHPENAAELAVLCIDLYTKTLTLAQLQKLERVYHILSRS